tara:strand:+ start:146 stop:850 length:705 start_codon:yes stop_codon:yes gene_type:complete
MHENCVLILGSKKDLIIPDMKVARVYSANGAAEKARYYLNKYSDVPFTAIVSCKEFYKNLNVQNRVLNSSPDLLISRNGKIDFQKFNFSEKTKFKFFNQIENISFQSNFFKFRYIDLLIQELKYYKEIDKKIYHLFYSLRHKPFVGVSTGFFSILHALREYPDHSIIISGIGMRGGVHYYNDKTIYSSNRANVDRGLISRLKDGYFRRLFSPDKELCKLTNIKYLPLKNIKDEI